MNPRLSLCSIESTADKRIAVGSTVKHKLGGPTMIVQSIGPAMYTVTCRWWSSDGKFTDAGHRRRNWQLHDTAFRADELEFIQ